MQLVWLSPMGKWLAVEAESFPVLLSASTMFTSLITFKPKACLTSKHIKESFYRVLGQLKFMCLMWRFTESLCDMQERLNQSIGQSTKCSQIIKRLEKQKGGPAYWRAWTLLLSFKANLSPHRTIKWNRGICITFFWICWQEHFHFHRCSKIE